MQLYNYPMKCSQCNKIISFQPADHMLGYIISEEALDYLIYKNYGMCNNCIQKLLYGQEDKILCEEQMRQIRY